jgi:glycosyltransferase involved in cell wall biosynthesis
MERPTLTLAMIVKNEAENLPLLAKSVEGCWDEWVIVDTGSTDNTVEIAKNLGATVYNFDWINDFSAARNFAFSKVKTDFVFWMDGDDRLNNKESLIDFRDNSLKYFDYVLAKYNYALDKNGKPIVSFARERIMRMSTNPRWEYFVHEGVKPPPGVRIHYCTNWAIDHHRTDEDMKKDKARNLNIFEVKRKEGKLDGRLTFYYGKELFENNQPGAAIPILLESIGMPIEAHDRILALQYACYSIQQETEKLLPEHRPEKLQQAINLATQALMLAPNRAEFHAIIGDCNLKLGRLAEALPSYGACKHCLGVAQPSDAFAGPIHSFAPLYKEYPRIQIAKIYFHLGRTDEAIKEIKECIELCPENEEARKVLAEFERLSPLTKMDGPRTKCTDIVFTCPPQTAYTFDEELYKTKGMGGSETALIEMAKWLKKFTNRRVIVFNMREQSLTSESGVEYFSTSAIPDYFAQFEPAVHIAWRHNIRLTRAPSYLWCHDLMIPGVENGLNQDKVLALSPFHRDFLSSAQGVPRGRILLTRNGIAPEKWDHVQKKPKNPYKFVYASSPDRGLDRLMHILDIVRQKHPVELHVYYGFDNLYKYGQAALADKLKSMASERPWVNLHGFTEQKQMYSECADAAIWCHPNDFIETYCITVLEMMMSGVFMISRKWGGLADTAKPFEAAGFAKLMNIDSVTPEQHVFWAGECVKAIESKAWENIKMDSSQYAWSSVAAEWAEMMNLWDSGDAKLVVPFKKPDAYLAPEQVL